MSDHMPEPADGPDYHNDLAYWRQRQTGDDLYDAYGDEPKNPETIDRWLDE